ncbi:MAG: hypothetical protein JWM84_69 [Nocardioides sp.]|nr:hypothetical protein [Nocardioides sp.]
MIRPVASELARLLRADVPRLEDEQFALTLAGVARNSPTPPLRRRAPLAVKVGAIAASVTVTLFGAAYASDLLAPAPPTNSNPTSPDSEKPIEREREGREPRMPDERVDGSPSPATSTEFPGPDGQPTNDQGSTPEDGTAGATAPAGTEDGHSPQELPSEQPPASDAGPDGGDSGDDDDGPGNDDAVGETDADDDPAPDDDPEDDHDGSEDENDLDEGSGEPEPQDENDGSDDD